MYLLSYFVCNVTVFNFRGLSGLALVYFECTLGYVAPTVNKFMIIAINIIIFIMSSISTFS